MAQLNNLLVTGDSRFLNTVHCDIDGNSETSTLASKLSTEQGTSAGARPVWYSYLGDNTRAVYNTSFTYNPSGGVLSATKFVGALQGNADTATIASKLGSSNIGSTIQPIYLNGGIATACTYTLGKSVPSNAVFTDEKVTQTESTNDGNYEVLISGTASTATTTEGANKSKGFRYNPYKNAVMEGYNTTASGSAAHAEGYRTTANGNYSHSEGYYSKATNLYAHAENQSYASGQYSHSEGCVTTSNGNYSHAEGYGAYAKGSSSHAEGYYTTATHKSQHVFGEFNALDTSTAVNYNRGTYVEIVGNGTNATTGRSNARTLDWNGNEKIAGNLTDKWGLQTSRSLFQSEFDDLTQEERDNGTTYYIKDGEPLRICDYIYPVGAIYMSVNNISPAILFGGTWERIKDRFLLAAGDDYTAGSTGGEAEHTLNINEMPTHRHLVKNASGNNTLASSTNTSLPDGPSWSFNDYGHDGSSGDGSSGKFYAWDAGGDQPHNNMPPYLTVYMWKRVPDPVQQEKEEGE